MSFVFIRGSSTDLLNYRNIEPAGFHGKSSRKSTQMAANKCKWTKNRRWWQTACNRFAFIRVHLRQNKEFPREKPDRCYRYSGTAVLVDMSGSAWSRTLNSSWIRSPRAPRRHDRPGPGVARRHTRTDRHTPSPRCRTVGIPGRKTGSDTSDPPS